MNSRITLLVLFVLAANLAFSQKEESEVTEVLDAWHLAAATADYDGYFGRMTEDAVFIGTDASENWQLNSFKEFSKPYFDKGKAWSFKAVERNIYFDNKKRLAWFDELLDTWMGICRGSGVLRLENGSWKVAHYVLSATIPNDDMRQVIQIKKTADSLQMVKLISTLKSPNIND